MKTVLVLGSTGSIGKSTLEVLDLHKENFKCIGLSANKNFQALHEQANKYSVKNICIQEGSTLETGIETDDFISGALNKGINVRKLENAISLSFDELSDDRTMEKLKKVPEKKKK